MLTRAQIDNRVCLASDHVVTGTSVISIFNVPDYEAQIDRAAVVLREGGLVVLPTETVYGVAARLDRPAAMERLVALRGGDATKPFIIHLASAAQAEQFINPANDYARRLMRKFWPGPVGLMFDVPADRRAAVAKSVGVAESTLYEAGAITLRCPDHLVATDVLRDAGGPVVLSKASTSGDRPDEIAAELDGKIDLLLDAGAPAHSRPSTLLHVRDNGYDIVRAGVYDARILERLLRTTFLFVCSGNTCRSPMAEAIAKKRIADRLHVAPGELESKGFAVTSAGTFAMPGSRATPAGVEAVRTLGADSSLHRSRPLTVELVHAADHVLVMGRSHAAAVLATSPWAADKIELLDPEGDIEDPIGSDLAVYQSLAHKMQVLIDKRLDKIDGLGAVVSG